MKQLALSKVLSIVACAMTLCSLRPAGLSADTAQYFYDELGRLSAMTDGQGNAAVYNYDAVGNLLSITRSAPGAPTVASITPTLIDAGTSVPITITGTGFQFVQLGSANPEIQISGLTTTATTITATLTVPNPTTFGSTALIVAALGGSAQASVTIRQPAAPSIAQVTPLVGLPGATLVLTGNHFSTKAGGNLVTFAGLNNTRIAGTVVSFSDTQVSAKVPTNAITGSVTVEVGGVVSNAVMVQVLSAATFTSVATLGTPTNPAVASANVGQVLTVLGSGLSTQSRLIFPTKRFDGVASTVAVSLTNIAADGSSAHAQVPVPNQFTYGTPVSGSVTLQDLTVGTAVGGIPLQIVPTVQTIDVFGASTPAKMRVLTTGINPSNTMAQLPGVPGQLAAEPFGVQPPTTVIVEFVRPAGFQAGSLRIITDGGTSNAFLVPGIVSIPSVAVRGTATDAAIASANSTQVIQLLGENLSNGLGVRFPTAQEFQGPGAAIGFEVVPLFNVSGNGQTGSVSVPLSATTGVVQINGGGTVPLQVVPDVSAYFLDPTVPFAAGNTLTLSGSGFREPSATVTFSGATSPTSVTDVFSENTSNNRLTVNIPDGATAGTLVLRTNGGTSPGLAVAGLTGLVATAAQGTPAIAGTPSANVNQTIQLDGVGLANGTQVRFVSTDHAGTAGTVVTTVQTAGPGATTGTVVVPVSATTGSVTVAGPGSVPLQIVPTITGASPPVGSAFAPGVVLTVFGSGFKEGATTVSFSGAAAAVPATDVLAGQFANDRLTVTIPPGANGVSYAVITDGGTSATRPFGALQGITAGAPRGTPQNPGQPSANVGQLITLQGVGFGPGSQAIFTSTTDTGTTGLVAAPLININVAGTSAGVIVPATATSGPVSVDGQGTVPLQIVPTIFTLTLPPGQTFSPGVVATLGGTGFKEGGTTVTFSGAGPVAATDVTDDNSRLTVPIPAGAGAGNITVTVDGHIGVFDTTRPSVQQVLPFNGQTNAPLNTSIAVLFDEPVQAATVTASSLFLTGPNGLVPGTVSLSSDQQTAIFAPTQPLEATNGYAVSFTTAITDLAGNALNPGTTTFSTGTVTDATGPTVATVSPVNGANAVPTNAVIRLYFSEALLPTTVTPQAITLSTGGSAVPTSMMLEQNNMVVRLQPTTALQANASYSVTVAPTVADLAGNVLATQFTSSLSTGAGADTTAPAVTSRIPADGATNVASDTTMVVTFTEPIEPATVKATTTFTLTGGGISGTVPGTFTFESGNQTVQFTPLFPLFAGQTFFLTLDGIEDQAGNRVASTTASFTIQAGSTGAVIPVFASVFAAPNALFANGQTITRVTIDTIADSSGFLVPDGTQVAVTAAPAFQLTSAGGTILGGTTSAADPRFKIFTTTNGRVRFDYQSPALVLAPGFSADGIIQVASVTTTGLPISLIGTSSVQLVTSQTANITFNPQVLLPNGTSQAEIHIVVRDPINTLDDFGRPIPAGTTMGVGVLSPAGPLGTINGGTVAPDPRYQLFNAKTGGIIDLTYTAPNLVQGPGEQAFETFSAVPVDPAGNLLGAFGFSSLFLMTGGCAGSECVPGGFTGPLPKLLVLSPGPGEDNVGTTAPITAEFSQSLTPASVTASTFAVSSGGTPIAGTYVLSTGLRGPNTIVTFTPTSPWTPGTVIDVAVTTGITNSAGNPLLTSAFNSFSIGAGPDSTGPSVVGASVGNGLTNVPHSAVINIQFNQPVNAVTLNATAFSVSTGGTPIAGRISLSNGEFGVNTIATFIQDQLLASDTLYTISVGTGVTDSSGNSLTPAFTSTFRTAVGTPVTDVGQPNVESVTPPDGQRDVPLNPRIEVRTDKAINPITLNSGSFDFFKHLASIEGMVAFAPDQKSWTFTPIAPLDPTTDHVTRVTNGLRDIAGNRLSSSMGSLFTTGTALANAAGPQITRVTPPNNDTNVFLNQPITIRFSEPLAVATVTSQTVIVSQGGVPVNGVLTLLEDNKAIRWVPSNGGTLSPNALHTITVTTGVAGLASNPLSAPQTFSFTTGTATDTTAPTVASISPLDGAQDVPRTQQIEVTFNEPIDPASALDGFFLEHNDTGASIAGALTLSPDRTTIQFVPTFPLFAGQVFNIFLDGITDSIGNLMAFVGSTFTTAVAAGTDTLLVPDSANVASNPTNLIADGLATSTITISGISRGGVPVADGTVIGVTTAPVFQSDSFPGSLLGGSPSGGDARLTLYAVVGGTVTLTYQTPSLPSGTNRDSYVQVVGVDATGAPMNRIGERRLRLFGTGGGQ